MRHRADQSIPSAIIHVLTPHVAAAGDRISDLAEVAIGDRGTGFRYQLDMAAMAFVLMLL